jgi:hypothetical protein
MVQRTVRVILRGGLGNQLFQYAAGVSLSNKLCATLTLDSTLLPETKVNSMGVTRWPEQLDEFNHHGSMHRRRFTSRLQADLHSKILHLDRGLGDISPTILRRFGRFSNESHSPLKHFRKLDARSTVINSYCNSPGFFLDDADEIRKSIHDLRTPSHEYEQLKEKALELEPLAVHVRLGDYRKLSHVYGVFDPSYLERAIRLQFSLTHERPIWLFSDEPDLALTTTSHLRFRLEVPPHLSRLSSLETLLVMSACKGLVASNSSFSWWAAFLKNQSQENIIFPRPFFALGGPQEPKDWLLNDWIQVGRTA